MILGLDAVLIDKLETIHVNRVLRLFVKLLALPGSIILHLNEFVDLDAETVTQDIPYVSLSRQEDQTLQFLIPMFVGLTP
jgi:hypothetical protein